jgi:hypothetical protein
MRGQDQAAQAAQKACRKHQTAQQGQHMRPTAWLPTRRVQMPTP